MIQADLSTLAAPNICEHGSIPFPCCAGVHGSQIVSVIYDKCCSKGSRQNDEMRINKRRNLMEYAGIESEFGSLYSINDRHFLCSPPLQDSILI